MFKKFTKFIASQADPSNTLIPVESFAAQEHFKVSRLLKKKRKPATIFRTAPYYQQTEFSLDDVLLCEEDGESTESPLAMEDGECSSQFTLTVCNSDQVDGKFSISVAPASVGMEGGASSSKEFSITLQKKVRPLKSLQALSRKRKIDMDLDCIQQLKRAALDLYVVYETLEASEETVYKESSRASGGCMAKIDAMFSAKAKTEKKQCVVIPKDCTLAFRAIHLYIEKGKWKLDFVGSGCGTFKYNKIVLGSGGYKSDGAPQGKLEIVEEEVKRYCAIFSELSSDLRVLFLNTITAVMGDRDLLQELSQKMDNFLEENGNYKLKTESTALQDLLSTLENSEANRRVQLAGGINYTLDALAELLDDQLLLLLEPLQRKIVSQQLKLVGNLLEHELEKGNEPFSVDASLLSFPGQEEQNITMALVGLSGVKLQGDGSAVPMEQPFEAVAALYVALHVLSLLSASE
ncbi:gasdermin-A2-like [Pithys albifrons albifrons]|uniref:gasdermin-A2-like n=1 Tax=Pithys albifrons albifrons TaxID=3385563 RepID=UPI003A5D096E